VHLKRIPELALDKSIALAGLVVQVTLGKVFFDYCYYYLKFQLSKIG
jgi:hypothetical protein